MPYPFFGRPAVYVDPSIVSFTADPAVVEMGSIVAGVTLSWTLAKTPKLLKVDNQIIAPNSKLLRVEGPFSSNHKWRLHCADEQEELHEFATLAFLNKAYWGLVDVPPTTSADILALDNSFFATTYRHTIQFGTPNGRLPCYAFPARFGKPHHPLLTTESPVVMIGTQANQTSTLRDYTVTAIDFTNLSGFTESYNVVTFNTPVFTRSTVVNWDQPVPDKQEEFEDSYGIWE